MNDSRLLKISKFLSKHLRHKPADIGIKLAPGGWIEINELLTACAKNKFPITRQELQLVVESNDKQRFSFDSTGTLIRANQGHSIEVDLQLEPVVPPDVLYHGTAKQSVESILQTGLSKMSRHHVHLSKDIATAKNVGARHGKPIVFAVNAVAMHQAGYIFYCSDNGVWLVDNIPPEYLQII
ncbi:MULTISPECIES: RNA 2'-phosphotransferase [unclassified Tolypothrix]|uniref:RNA 2'-phosphotransferase n=1 Tax=unclassified Tolypothrix TaxID=2649714 RepID=UPI0005EAC0AD|nr:MULTISPECIES: RNA 2'-phosphotransferase [unclassified Tolypothrix]BAY89791.1 phosphotransferase KptA/Tpt1 [Microchaete diplosiphon NIES-3275]EKF00781.1 RNA 2'-phosphotransferase [Tolypothrix sp. PCC 7601]MBE9083446.1 RNA 2'-phosphotransferase [Tolypothrix sp. LEGE 11397]UYD24046.1 RNA 2'-phosphotransferase [Tolypothrix sp. PCC 7712]UYD33724.1 RNA 2'-phosphotransferase [Tolypothrix sp. PCC 7601]